MRIQEAEGGEQGDHRTSMKEEIPMGLLAQSNLQLSTDVGEFSH